MTLLSDMRRDDHRFIEEGDSVYFPKNKARHHISFVKTYQGMTIIQARRKMKSLWAGHSLQDEMLHYLRTKKHVV
jgi:ASC-1-like (ASCH) protein